MGKMKILLFIQIFALLSLFLVHPASAADPVCANTLGVGIWTEGDIRIMQIDSDCSTKDLYYLDWGASIYDIIALDFDGDSLDEYAYVIDSDTKTIRVIKNNGDLINRWNSLKQDNSYSPLVYGNNVLAKGNFNSDKNTEELAYIRKTASYKSEIYIFEYDKDTISDPTPLLSQELNFRAYSVAAADIDKDGIYEVAIGDTKGIVRTYKVIGNSLSLLKTLDTGRDEPVGGIAFGNANAGDELDVAVELYVNAGGKNVVFLFLDDSTSPNYKYGKSWDSNTEATDIIMGDVSDKGEYDEVIVTTALVYNEKKGVWVLNNKLNEVLGSIGDVESSGTNIDSVELSNSVDGAKIMFSVNEGINEVRFTTGDKGEGDELSQICSVDVNDDHKYVVVSQGSCREICDDGIDNDKDMGEGHVGADCADPVCQAEHGIGGPNGEICAEDENTLELCTDGFDNDADNDADFYDDGCKSVCPDSAVIPEGVFSYVPGANDGSDGCCGDDDYFISFLGDENDDIIGWDTNTVPDEYGHAALTLDIEDYGNSKKLTISRDYSYGDEAYCKSIYYDGLSTQNCEGQAKDYCDVFRGGYCYLYGNDCYPASGNSDPIPCKYIPNDPTCSQTYNCERSYPLAYSDWVDVNQDTNYLLVGKLDAELVGSNSDKRIKIYVEWVKADDSITQSTEYVEITENKDGYGLKLFFDKSNIPSDVKKVRVAVELMKTDVNSFVKLYDLRFVQTQDYGWVTDDHEWRCNYDVDNGWRWEDASTGWTDAAGTSHDVKYKISQVADIDTISNSNEWFYCNATGNSILGCSAEDSYTGKGELGVSLHSTFSSGTGGFGIAGLCPSDRPFYCGRLNQNGDPINSNDEVITDPTRIDDKCIENVEDCDSPDDIDEDGCSNSEEVNICMTNPYYADNFGTDPGPYNCLDGAYTCNSGDSNPFGGQGSGDSDYETYCKDHPDECSSSSGQSYTIKGEDDYGENACSDGVDNDYDGKADADDADCCQSNPLPAGCTITEDCDNNEDDNGNTLVDCADPECQASFAECKVVYSSSPNDFALNESFICNDYFGFDKFHECCSNIQCKNKNILSSLQNPLIDDFTDNIVLASTSTTSLASYDIYETNDDTFIRKFAKYTDTGSNGGYKLRFLFSDMLRDKIIKWNDFYKKHSKNLEFDFAFIDKADDQYEDISRGKIGLELVYVKSGSTIISSDYIEDIRPFFTNGLVPNRWHHVVIPLTNFPGFFQNNTLYGINIVAKFPTRGFFDKPFISFDNNYYCSGSIWLKGLNPPDDASSDIREQYRQACDAQLSFTWTGTRCCGVKTTPDEKEFWDNTHHSDYLNVIHEYNGCFKGYTIKNDKRVNDTLNIPQYNNLIYENGEYQSCNKRMIFENSPKFTDDTGETYTIKFAGSKTKIEPNNQDRCTEQGRWFCSEADYWKDSLMELYYNSGTYDTQELDFKQHTLTKGHIIPPGTNLIRNGNFLAEEG